MPQNFRHFQAGPDPSGRTWLVDLLWLQTAISIRHSDSVDVKFMLKSGGERTERVISLPHPDLVALGRSTGRPLTDAWCMALAARHLKRMIQTGEDSDKPLVTVPSSRLAWDAARVAP
jgi:hypothetical protein